MIKSWSPTALQNFERCKFFAYLKHDQRIPEPERPLPPGKTEHANDRGTRVHTACELFVKGEGPMPAEAKHYAEDIDKLRRMYGEGRVSLEGEWGMDDNWTPTPWKTAWLRLKIDALAFISPTEAVVIDYKTGRRFGNELKHNDQMLMYQLCAFLRHPELEVVHTELWYLDVDDFAKKTYTRNQGLRFMASINKRGVAMTTCTEFPPASNKNACKWCQYGQWNGGQCQSGVR
jgi:CRISPR/Cas system-associated exonuclease Cas4 (RecB family)